MGGMSYYRCHRVTHVLGSHELSAAAQGWLNIQFLYTIKLISSASTPGISASSITDCTLSIAPLIVLTVGHNSWLHGSLQAVGQHPWPKLIPNWDMVIKMLRWGMSGRRALSVIWPGRDGRTGRWQPLWHATMLFNYQRIHICWPRPVFRQEI